MASASIKGGHVRVVVVRAAHLIVVMATLFEELDHGMCGSSLTTRGITLLTTTTVELVEPPLIGSSQQKVGHVVPLLLQLVRGSVEF